MTDLFPYLPQDLPAPERFFFPRRVNPRRGEPNQNTYLPGILKGMRHEEEIIARLLILWQEAGAWTGITRDQLHAFINQPLAPGETSALKELSVQAHQVALGWLVRSEHLRVDGRGHDATLHPTPLLLEKMRALRV